MSQRSWFITGVTSGFGRHLAELLLERGDRVAGTVRRRAAMADLEARYGERLWLAHLDVTDLPEVRRVVDRAFDEFDRIDVVINNAGYGLFGAAEELTDEQVVHQVNTNLLGSIQVVRSAVPHLRGQGGGRILQVSTYGGQATNPGSSLYNASKWGIEGFMESTAKDIAPFGIGVTIVEPGSARTEFRTGSAQLATPMAVYDDTPAAMPRGIRNPALPSIGDPTKMAQAMIDSVDREPAPRRLVLGSDSYQYMHAALTERIAELEAQQGSAAATDA